MCVVLYFGLGILPLRAVQACGSSKLAAALTRCSIHLLWPPDFERRGLLGGKPPCVYRHMRTHIDVDEIVFELLHSRTRFLLR